MKNKYSIKSWALDDRPRERLVLKGKFSLSDTELLAILIRSGNREESAVDLAKRMLLSVNNSLHKLSKLSIEELMNFKGIGEAKAVSIVTALELGKRRQFQTNEVKPKVSCSKDVFLVTQPLIGDLSHEEFWVLFFNNANEIIAKQQLSKGGFTGTIVDIRLLFKRALELQSIAIIVCHNHPSGKLKPSKSDIHLTRKIKKAGETLDIKLLDHLIITEKAYFSFVDEGVL
ncbi:DNA repair protein RadC [Tenacibaculum sp. 190130A14a]|uniref:DNA repair protein RadC n=1 Tax=Tenacibaculum polynesiense TaxID=3137857 RepID=A0ABP1ETW7_9FLAO